MADENVSDMFKAWGLHHYQEVFEEHGIDIFSLGFLTDDMMKEIIPKIGDRAKLKTNLAEWRNVIDHTTNKDSFLECPQLTELVNTREEVLTTLPSE